MKNGHTTRQKTPAGRYALLDELRGLDLVSMMLYHACWDMMSLFGIWMDWYTGMPGHLWQQTICWVFILLSGFCAPFGRHMLRRGTVVFGAGAVCGVLPGQLGLGGPWRLEADAAAEPVCQLLYCIFWLLPGLVLLRRLLWPAAVAVFVLGGVLPAQGGGPQTHGTAAPPGVPGAGLDGPALAFAVSAAPAGDLRRTFGRGSSFCIKGLTQPGSCGILSVVRRY